MQNKKKRASNAHWATLRVYSGAEQPHFTHGEKCVSRNSFICKVIINPDEIRVANVFLLCHYSCIPFTPQQAWITTWPACFICKSPLYLFFFVSHLPCNTTLFHPASPEWNLPSPPMTTLATDLIGASQGFAIGNTACTLPRTKCHFPSFFCIGYCSQQDEARVSLPTA